MTGLQMTPGWGQGLEIAFAIPTSTDQRRLRSWWFSAGSAGEPWDDTTVEPGALETCKPKSLL